jgi:hypothetical protein
MGMAKTLPAPVVQSPREVRPFSFLEPARPSGRLPELDLQGCERLAEALTDSIPMLVRSLVDWSIARQRRDRWSQASAQPIQLAVLNRRRRAARAWCNAIAEARVDEAVQHAVAQQWLPILCGSGTAGADFAAGRSFVEFVRGLATACLFDAPKASLLGEARGLHVLETVLAVHLGALERAVRRSPTPA